MAGFSTPGQDLNYEYLHAGLAWTGHDILLMLFAPFYCPANIVAEPSPKPYILHPKPYTRNPKPETLNSKPQDPRPKRGLIFHSRLRCAALPALEVCGLGV